MKEYIKKALKEQKASDAILNFDTQGMISPAKPKKSNKNADIEESYSKFFQKGNEDGSALAKSIIENFAKEMRQMGK